MKYSFIILLSLWMGLGFAQELPAQGIESNIREAILTTAKKYLGVPYVYGAQSPKAFDCSGFVRHVYAQAAGITLPRSSRQLWAAGQPIDPSKAKPGDVLVFDTAGGAPSHVAILLSQNQIIHAVSEGPKTGVILSSLQDRYFAPRLLGARLFIPSTQPAPADVMAKPSSTVSKPAPASGSVASPTPKAELAVSIIGFTITNQAAIYADKIPALTGSALQYAVTNGTGRDGTFEILFYKMDMDPSKHQTLRQERISIKAGAMVEIEPYIFSSPGQYKLILKTHDNLKRVERIWKVVE